MNFSPTTRPRYLTHVSSSRYWNLELQKLKKLEYTVTKDGDKTPLKKDSRPKLYKALFRAFWLPYFIIGIFVFIQVAKKRKKSMR
jgi:hypothetical protein